MLALDRNLHLGRERLERAAEVIADRQIERLSVVGSNDTTTALIEQSYRRLLALIDRHLAGGTPFRPGGVPEWAISDCAGN